MSRSGLNLAMAAGLVALPVLLLAVTFDRPGWMWLLVLVVGTGAVFACYQHMTATIDYAREQGLMPEPEPAPPMRESFDKAVVGFLAATGLLPLFERLVKWLAARLDRDRP